MGKYFGVCHVCFVRAAAHETEELGTDSSR